MSSRLASSNVLYSNALLGSARTGFKQTDATIYGHLWLRFRLITVPMIAVLNTLSLLSKGLAQRDEGSILGTAMVWAAHSFAWPLASAARIRAIVLMANSSLALESCDAPLHIVVTMSPTSFCAWTTGGKNPSKDHCSSLLLSFAVAAVNVIFSGCVIWPALTS